MSNENYLILTLAVSMSKLDKDRLKWGKKTMNRWLVAGEDPTDLCLETVQVLKGKGYKSDLIRQEGDDHWEISANLIVKDEKIPDELKNDLEKTIRETVIFMEEGFTNRGNSFISGWEDVETKGELLAERHALDMATQRTEAKRETRRI